MVDPFHLASDIVETTVYLATPPLLWLFLFLFAWEDEPRARAAGFGRRTFWLLVPGGLLGLFADLPIFGWNGDVLAVNLAGGLIPVVLSMLLIVRRIPDAERFTVLFLVSFIAVSGSLLVALFLPLSSLQLDLVYLLIAALGPSIVYGVGLARPAEDRLTFRRASAFLALASGVLIATFFTTATLPGLGIVSAFPWYLVAPLAAGAVIGALARPVFRLPGILALPIAYASTTFGVLVGADLLREPPLYGGANATIYAIGGAGTGDLLYLSGLLALVAAFVVVRLLRRDGTDDLRYEEGAPTSDQWLRRALTGAVDGRIRASVAASDDAVTTAVAQSRRLLDLPPAPAPDPSLAGLPAPPWVVADRRNLASLARSATDDPGDATRAWMTGRWLVRFAREVGRRRFASRTSRGSAFAIDLLLLTAPAVLVWYGLATSTPGTSVQLLQSVPLNVAALGYASFGLFYFVLAEQLFGVTLGKRVLGLRVTGRDLRPPGPLAAFVRNLPKTVTLILVGYVGVVAVVLAVRGSTYTVAAGGFVNAAVSLVPLAALLLLSVGLPSAVAAVVIGATPERQRLGDLWAGTWVVRTDVTPVRPVPVPPAARPSA